jgi:hypothetical protein
MTEAALTQKKCTPCRGGVPPKKIKGLHENDFILAAKINEIATGVGTRK